MIETLLSEPITFLGAVYLFGLFVVGLIFAIRVWFVSRFM